MTLQTVTVTWNELDTGQAPLGGYVSFQLSAVEADSADGLEIHPEPARTYYFTNGTGTSDPLTANDNASLVPAGSYYVVTVAIRGQQPYTFKTLISHSNGASQTLAYLYANQAQPVAQYSQYLPLPSGTPAAGDVPVVISDNSTATAWGPGGGGGSGTVTTVSVASANGFAGTVANPTTTPAVTLETTVTGLLKGNGSAVSAAASGTDYLAPNGSGAALTGITAAQVGADASGAAAAVLATSAQKSANLSDLASTGTARTNLGLGSAATHASTDFDAAGAAAAAAAASVPLSDLPLSLANGGTGQTAQQAALDALAGAVTSGQVLRGNGTHVQLAAIQAGDVPTLNQSTSGTAANLSGTPALPNGTTATTQTTGDSSASIATDAFVATAAAAVQATLTANIAGMFDNPTPQVNAVSARTVQNFSLWLKWLAENNALGAVSEMNIPGAGVNYGGTLTANDVLQWSQVAENWLRVVDDYAMPVIESGVNFTPGDATPFRNPGTVEVISGSIVLTPPAATPCVDDSGVPLMRHARSGPRGFWLGSAAWIGSAVTTVPAGFSNLTPYSPQGYTWTAHPSAYAYAYAAGARIVRVATNWEALQSAAQLGTSSLTTLEVTRLSDAITAAGQAGLQCVIDLHNGCTYVQGAVITALTISSTTATATLSATHNVQAGSTVTLSGVAGFVTNPNGSYTVTGVSGSQVTFTVTATSGTYTASSGLLQFVWVLGDGNLTQAMLADLWTALSTEFSGNSYVYAYELMNEPGAVPIPATSYNPTGGGTLEPGASIPVSTSGFPSGKAFGAIMQFPGSPGYPAPFSAVVASGSALTVVDVAPGCSGVSFSSGSSYAVNSPQAVWEAASQAVVTAIRANSDTTQVWVSGYFYQNAWWWSASHPRAWISDTANNTRYVAHNYWSTNPAGDSVYLPWAQEVANCTTAAGGYAPLPGAHPSMGATADKIPMQSGESTLGRVLPSTTANWATQTLCATCFIAGRSEAVNFVEFNVYQNATVTPSVGQAGIFRLGPYGDLTLEAVTASVPSAFTSGYSTEKLQLSAVSGAAGVNPPSSVSAASVSGSSVTFTPASVAGFAVGQNVYATGMAGLSVTAFAGVVTAVGASTVTVLVTGTAPAGTYTSGGTLGISWQKQAGLIYAVGILVVQSSGTLPTFAGYSLTDNVSWYEASQMTWPWSGWAATGQAAMPAYISAGVPVPTDNVLYARVSPA